MNDVPISDFVFTTSLSAFIGAFFSYLFVRLAEVFKTLYDRQLSGFNALVAVERWLASTYDDISSSIFAADDTLKARGASEIIISFNKLCPPSFNWDLLEKVSNLSFVNEMASYGSDLRKLERTIEDLNSMHTEIRSSFLSKSTDAATYRTNFSIYLDKLAELRKFLLQLEAETKRLTAITRLLLRKKPLFSRIVLWAARPQMPSQHEINQQLASLNQEMRAIRKKNAAKIERIQEQK